MTFRTELLGRGSEQQQPLGLLAELLDQFVFRAGRGLAPFEMMSLVNHQQIPTGLFGLFGTLGVGCEKIDAAQDHLIIEKRIRLG